MKEEETKDRLMKKQMLVYKAKMLATQSGAACAHHLSLDASKYSLNVDEDSQRMLGILKEMLLQLPLPLFHSREHSSRDRSTLCGSSSSVPSKDVDLYRLSSSLARSLNEPPEMLAHLVEERRFDTVRKRTGA